MIIVNFANADMVGHSGMIEPTVKAVEVVDACLGRIYAAVKQHGASWIITADHGNAEMLIDPVSGGPHTAHTTNPVPFIMVTDQGKKIGVREGGSSAGYFADDAELDGSGVAEADDGWGFAGGAGSLLAAAEPAHQGQRSGGEDDADDDAAEEAPSVGEEAAQGGEVGVRGEPCGCGVQHAPAWRWRG